MTELKDATIREALLRKLERQNGLIRIEAKWQQSPGSVDEKLPYLFQNALEKCRSNTSSL